MINDKYKGKIQTNHQEMSIEYNGNNIPVKNNKLVREISKMLEGISKIENNEKYFNFIDKQMKDNFLVLTILIFDSFKDKSSIEEYVLKYIKNNILSNFNDLDNITMDKISKKEYIKSDILWLNLSEVEKQKLKEDYVELKLNNSELYNIDTLKKIDKTFLDGIISNYVNIEELLKKGNKKNETTKR